jgi:integrase
MDAPCTEVVQVPWPHPLRPENWLIDYFRFYIHEHCYPLGQDVKRIAATARRVSEFFEPDFNPINFRRSHYRDYVAYRSGEGVRPASIRRELVILQAALNHNFKEERFPAPFKIQMPAASAPLRRFLTKEEWARVMAQPMTYRLRMFFRLAIHTGARARAIEELTWSRVDFANGLIDYNVPGRRVTKKRRAVVPMSDELRRLLEAAYQRPDRDEFVIGRGPSGRTTSCYHLAKRAMRAAGIDERGVARHVCRKSFASWRLQAGQPIAKVAALIGDNATTCEKSYAFLLPEHLREAVNAA